MLLYASYICQKMPYNYFDRILIILEMTLKIGPFYLWKQIFRKETIRANAIIGAAASFWKNNISKKLHEIVEVFK